MEKLFMVSGKGRVSFLIPGIRQLRIFVAASSEQEVIQEAWKQWTQSYESLKKVQEKTSDKCSNVFPEPSNRDEWWAEEVSVPGYKITL